MNAVKPSFVSSDFNTAPNSWLVMLMRFSSVSYAEARTILRDAHTASGAEVAIILASSTADSTALPGSTNRLTKPRSYARWAGVDRPSKSLPLPRFGQLLVATETTRLRQRSSCV